VKVEIYELNSHVLVGGEIPAVITAVSIRPAENSVRVSYEVTWWDERARKCDWVEPSEIKPQKRQKNHVEFCSRRLVINPPNSIEK
jgi:hypothetical protein